MRQSWPKLTDPYMPAKRARSREGSRSRACRGQDVTRCARVTRASGREPERGSRSPPSCAFWSSGLSVDGPCVGDHPAIDAGVDAERDSTFQAQS